MRAKRATKKKTRRDLEAAALKARVKEIQAAPPTWPEIMMLASVTSLHLPKLLCWLEHMADDRQVAQGHDRSRCQHCFEIDEFLAGLRKMRARNLVSRCPWCRR